MSSFSQGVVIGLPVCRADPDGNILERTAEISHGMPLEMGKNQSGVIDLEPAAHNVLLQMKVALHRDAELTELIHYFYRCVTPCTRASQWRSSVWVYPAVCRPRPCDTLR